MYGLERERVPKKLNLIVEKSSILRVRGIPRGFRPCPDGREQPPQLAATAVAAIALSVAAPTALGQRQSATVTQEAARVR